MDSPREIEVDPNDLLLTAVSQRNAALDEILTMSAIIRAHMRTIQKMQEQFDSLTKVFEAYQEAHKPAVPEETGGSSGN